MLGGFFMEEKSGLSHRVVLNDRNQGSLTGILDVISFDESMIVLDTDMGLLTIKGNRYRGQAGQPGLFQIGGDKRLLPVLFFAAV